MKTVRGNPAAWLALMLLPALSGCGAAVSVGSTIYSTSEAIATVVKDAVVGTNADKPDASAQRPE